MKTTYIAGLLLAFLIKLSAQTTDTIYIESNGIRLHAVISIPLNLENCPLAIIIAGSGPTDLNGNPPNMPNNCLKYLSDSLVENNIATLRFDKRGIGKSFYAGLNEADLTISLYANDVVSIIKYCQEKGYNDIFVIGHSEGSLLGLMAIQTIHIKGFVSVSGVGNTADVILKKQLKSQIPPDYFTQVELMIDSLKNNQGLKNVPPQLKSLFRPSVQPYLVSWFNINPAELIRKLSCPSLIIQGNKDIQVDIEEAKILAKASVNKKFMVVANMNHVLKTIKGKGIQENYDSYSDPSLPINSDLVKGIVNFIDQKR